MKRDTLSHGLRAWCPSSQGGKGLYEEACAVVPQADLCEGEALDSAGSNTVTLPKPKGGSKRGTQSRPKHCTRPLYSTSRAGFGPFLALSLGHAAALAPVTILADALALGAAVPPRLRPSRVRVRLGAWDGLRSLHWWHLAGGAGRECLGPRRSWIADSAAGRGRRDCAPGPGTAARAHRRGRGRAGWWGAPAARLPRFRQLVLVAALVLGSHAMHDAFAVIRWRAAGVSPAMVSVLWSESVAAEVLVFFVLGPALVTGLTPAGALVVAALAGMLRWAVMAQSAEVLALALVQPLHGLTFALLHLACMRLLVRIVPPGLEGTAQALYGTVGIGAASAGLTLVSGVLYARVGAQGFWAIAALCALAVPLTWPLRQPADSASGAP